VLSFYVTPLLHGSWRGWQYRLWRIKDVAGIREKLAVAINGTMFT
jgi:hypothetical protein